MQKYVEVLTKEIENGAKEYPNRKVVSVFFGGGTPTVLEIPMLKQLMQAVLENWDVAEDAEITTEANPGTLTPSFAVQLKKMGFNRISIGVQAWQNRLLQYLGRIHTIEEFTANYKAVREAGFENVNIDVMFALPHQTMADWMETLEKIVELKPEHISAYSLILEEGTKLYEKWQKGEWTPIEDDLDREMYHRAVQYLCEKGYVQYEISNFAKAGKESRHNCIYWQTEEYLGLGLGAHAYMNRQRFHNPYDLQAYIAANGVRELLQEEKETLSEQDAMAEFMFLGLRMREGVSFDKFRVRFGKEMKEIYGNQIRKLQQKELIAEDETGIRLTLKGIDVSNLVFTEFLF